MTIETSTFGRLELSGKEAAQFLKQVAENKPNPQATAALQRGRAILQQILPAKPAAK
jgi:glycine cleavage system aminomethyltransferase T